MKFRIGVWVPLVSLALASCGGGGGGGGGPMIAPPPPAKIGGIWLGTGRNDVTGQVVNVGAIVTEDRRARFLTSEGVQIVAINPLTVSGNDVSGDMRGYAPIGFTFRNGEPVQTGTLEGTVRERDSFSGTFETSETNETGDFDLLYDTIYERDSSLALMEAVWLGFDESGFNTFFFDINLNGVITGQDVFGCSYSGQVNLIDTDFNAYELAVTITGCGALNGDYDGLGALDDDQEQNDVFGFQIDNNLVIVTSVVFRS